MLFLSAGELIRTQTHRGTVICKLIVFLSGEGCADVFDVRSFHTIARVHAHLN